MSRTPGVNAPLVAVHNNPRDGIHRRAIPRGRGRVAYEANLLGGGCPYQAGAWDAAASTLAAAPRQTALPP